MFNDRKSITSKKIDMKQKVRQSLGTVILMLSLGALSSTFAQPGSIDASFVYGTGFNAGSVNTIAVQSDGKIIVGGSFTSYNGTPCNRIVRLNDDGSVDPTFNIGSGFNFAVNAIAILNSGHILVGGDFTEYNTAVTNRLVKLNSNGSRDVTFTGGTNAPVFTLAVQNDNKILVGGSFSMYGLATRMRLVRINDNGSEDGSFWIGQGFNYGVYSIAIQSDGKVLVGGSFTSYQSQAHGKIIRLNSNGNIDATFNSGTGFATSSGNIVHKILLQSDGNIVVGGIFANFNGTAVPPVIRLTTTGGLDNSFVLNTGFLLTGITEFNSMSFVNTNKIIIGARQGGQPKLFIIDGNGNIDPLFPVGIFDNNNFIRSVIVQPDGRILVGGAFTTYNATSANRIVRLHSECVPVTATQHITECGSYTWINGVTYTSSTNTPTYTFAGGAANGCDSIVTLNLTINPVASGVDIQTACGSYTWLNGVTYTNSTNTPTYTFAGGAANGCDSIVTLNLTINPVASGVDAQVACGSYTWLNGVTYTSSTNTPTYTFIGGAANGCDSIVTLSLTVTTINTNVIISSGTITAAQSGANYQWIDCDNNSTPISGADQISFTPAQTGNYAVLVTQNGCEATSDCYYVEISSVGIKDVDFNDSDFNLYPNPNTGIFTFETTHLGKYSITNSLGQVIFDFEMNSGKKELHLPYLAKGVYYVLPKEGINRPVKFIVN